MGRPKLSPAQLEARGSLRKNSKRYQKKIEALEMLKLEAKVARAETKVKNIKAGNVAAQEAAVAARDYPKVIEGYTAAVISGQIPAGKFVRLAVQRHLDDLKRVREPDFPYEFKLDKVVKALAFMEALPHVKGRWALRRELLIFGPWQCFIIGSLFGWVRKRDGKRRFREAYVCVPRKNTKSTMAAAIGDYMLVEDGEYGAEVYAGATSEKQAWEVFGPAKLMLQKLPKLCAKHGIEIWARALVKAEDNSRFWPLIGKPGDGASPSCAIADEYHEHLTSEQVDTMQTGMGAREQPLMLIITTCGTNMASPCYDKHKEIEKILQGIFQGDETFGIIYSIDVPTETEKGDDWADPKSLVKANPNIGVSVDQEFLEAQQRQAVMNPTYQNRFKTKHLNLWCNASVAGINSHFWQLAADPLLKLDEFKGQQAYFILDLASKLDICAFMQLFVKVIKGLNHYYVFGRYYLPEETIHSDVASTERPNQDAYKRWVAQGHLLATDGAELDFAAVRQDVLDLKSTVQVKELVYDPWRATQLAQELSASGALCVEFPQGAQLMAMGFDELNAALAAGRFHHDGNPVLAWMASNTYAKSIIKGLTVPAKEANRSGQKIDGIVAVCMGLARALAAAPQAKQPQLMIF